ncbi:MAG: chromatin protein Cren7 [Ignisphaera sp.]|nr:chromatin protein Cren7 [Ignisphaera sp.]MCX8168154.1 chromatin protein Cren7 [Ignisphaera sp.]MDW8085206.1 chromatin protein Cren7 [Ignisphaera sp.]
MPRKSQKNPNICPRCGTVVPSPKRTWQLVAPIPDSSGRITVTVMGAYECSSCNYKWRAVISKMKVGGDSIEIEGSKGKELRLADEEKESRKSTVIELDLREILEEE